MLATVLFPADSCLLAMESSIVGIFIFDLAPIQNQGAKIRYYDMAWMIILLFAHEKVRQLSIGGGYGAAIVRPDRCVCWRFARIREGMRLIEKYTPPVRTEALAGLLNSLSMQR